MKSQKSQKGKSKAAVKLSALMNQSLLTYIRDQTKTRVELLIEEEAGR